MMKTNGNNESNVMNPSAYTHFLAKLQTSRIRNLETREKMAQEGAALECLDDLDDVTRAIEKAINTLEVCKASRAASMEEEAAIRKANQDRENALKRAEAQARRAAKASQVPSQEEVPPVIPQDDGPQGPEAIGA
jgi:hypothetical protein